MDNAVRVVDIAEVRKAREQVEARRAEEKEKIGGGAAVPELPPQFVLECFRSSELGDGTLYAALQQGKFLFNNATGEWLRWSGHHWQRDTMNASLSGVEDVVHTYSSTLPMVAMDDPGIFKDMGKRLTKLRTGRGRENTIKMAATLSEPLAISGVELDDKPLLFPCANGVIDLETGSFRPGKQEDLLMRASPVEWKEIDAEAVTWRRALLEIMGGRQEMVDFLQRFMGYCISGLNVEHFFVVFWGRGRNGKSIIVEAFKRVLGPLAKPIASEMLLDQGKFGGKNASGPSPEIMSLRGVRMAFGSETDDGRRISPSRVKWLSGGDTLVGRNPHDKYEVSFAPTHKLVLLTNHKPGAPADDYAFWERCLLVPFGLSFVNREPQAEFERRADPDLLAKLMAESSGILAWLVEGFLLWQRDGLKPPAAVLEATAEYRRGEDTMADFIDTCCELGPDYSVDATELYNSFSEWWEEVMKTKFVPAQKKFGRIMKEKYESRKVGGKYRYYGIKLKPAEQKA
ncbi:MAG: phage/plasmid primase, P4 family [Humidesulfovibrio sp.]